MNILVVDDDALIATVLRGMLERDGHAVETAGSGTEGIARFGAALAAGTPHDIVFTHLSKPELGQQVAAAVKRQHPDTCVVALSGRAPGQATAVPADVDRTLAKPVRLADLRALIAGVGASAGRGETLREFASLRSQFLARSREEMPGLVAALERLRERGGREPDELLALLHRLGGSAAMFGLPAVPAQVGRIRSALAGQPVDPPEAAWASLAAELQHLQALLQEPGHPPGAPRS